MIEPISDAPRLLVMKISAREKSTRRLSPSVSVALSRIPSSRFHKRIAGLLDFVEKHEAQLHPLGVILVQHFLAQQRMRFAMAEISGRRADQFRDLMAVLELGAIDLDHRARIAHQAFRRGFHQTRFAGAGGAEKQEIADRPPRARHAREVGLINVDDLFDRLILADDPFAQIGIQSFGFETSLSGIKLLIQAPHVHPPPVES